MRKLAEDDDQRACADSLPIVGPSAAPSSGIIGMQLERFGIYSLRGPSGQAKAKTSATIFVGNEKARIPVPSLPVVRPPN
jgi:hypothetical protein